MEKSRDRGTFITLEGGEGSGKSTVSERLADSLRRRNLEVLVTREPGGSPGAEEIRTLLVEGEIDRWDDTTEVLLHYAARRDHLVRTIWPALDRGAWVVCDRFVDSTVAYQGYGHGFELERIKLLSSLVVGAFSPNVTIVLDVPVDIGLTRARARRGIEQRYEKHDIAFHNRVRAGFLEIAKTESGRCAVIDANQQLDDVAAAVESAVAAKVGLV